MLNHGCVSALTGQSSQAIDLINSGLEVWQSTGATAHLPLYSANLSSARAKSCEVDQAWQCIRKATTAIETTKETLCEAEVYRVAGEITLESPEANSVEAQAYFEHALTVAREQQAKSWELRAATSLARLWRDQGKRTEARDLLAPIYGWFTEGFDTLDLKEAKALLEQLEVK